MLYFGMRSSITVPSSPVWHISFPHLTCPIPLVFHSVISLQHSLVLSPPSLGKQRMMKTVNEMPPKYNLSGGRSSKPNVIQPRERNRSSTPRWVLYCSLVYLQMRLVTSRLSSAAVCLNLTNCELSVEPSWLTEFRCVSVCTCECVWARSYVTLMV